MKSFPLSQRFVRLLMLAIAACAALAIGAWQSAAPSTIEAAEQHSAFVQSGGVAADADPRLSESPQVLGHANAASAPGPGATSF